MSSVGLKEYRAGTGSFRAHRLFVWKVQHMIEDSVESFGQHERAKEDE